MKKALNPFKFARVSYEYMGGRAKAMYDIYVDLTRATRNGPYRPPSAEQIARLTACYVLESMSEAGLYSLNKMEEEREVKKPDPIPDWAKGWAREPQGETGDEKRKAVSSLPVGSRFKFSPGDSDVWTVLKAQNLNFISDDYTFIGLVGSPVVRAINGGREVHVVGKLCGECTEKKKQDTPEDNATLEANLEQLKEREKRKHLSDKDDEYAENCLGNMANGTRILWGAGREGAPNWNVWRVMRCLDTANSVPTDHVAIAGEDKPYIQFLHEDTKVRLAPLRREDRPKAKSVPIDPDEDWKEE